MRDIRASPSVPLGEKSFVGNNLIRLTLVIGSFGAVAAFFGGWRAWYVHLQVVDPQPGVHIPPPRDLGAWRGLPLLERLERRGALVDQFSTKYDCDSMGPTARLQFR